MGKEHAQQHYEVTTDWTGTCYVGIHLLWDYQKHHVHFTCQGMSPKHSSNFNTYVVSNNINHTHMHAPIKYGAKKQYATRESTAPLASPDNKRFIQRVAGKFLFYGHAVDGTVLTPISAIVSQSANPTRETLKRTRQLLDYWQHRKMLFSHITAVT